MQLGLSAEDSVTQNIILAVLLSTRAFQDVSIDVYAHINLIVVRIVLKRSWDRRIFSWLKKVWLYRAESKAMQFVPTGWRILVSYGHTKRVTEDIG